jgi:hypothetical protein
MKTQHAASENTIWSEGRRSVLERLTQRAASTDAARCVGKLGGDSNPIPTIII